MDETKKLIAIAGGTSPTLGAAIVNALVESTTCTPVILSRRKPDAEQKQKQAIITPSGISVPIRYVDYNSDLSLLNALKDVHTVISVIMVPGPDWASCQINLMHAAMEAGVKRFAPSEFEQGPKSDGKVDVLGLKWPVWDACLSSGLEVGRFECGGFMNALVVSAAENPRWRDDDKRRNRIVEALHGIRDQDPLCDLQHETAREIIKDDGTSPRITFTEIGDVGRFVAAACELPDGSWKRNMSMVGQTLTVSEVTRTIEEVTGITLKRSTVGYKELRRRVDRVEGVGGTPDEIMTKLWAQLQLVMLEDTEGAGWLSPVVNELCPQVKPQSLREYLTKCFST